MPDREAWDALTEWAYSLMGAERFRSNTTTTADHMDFTFKDENEALMFQLRCGHARRLSDAEITTEYIGGLLGG